MKISDLTKTELDQKKYYNKIAEEYESHYNNEYTQLYRTKLYDSFLNRENFNGINVLDAMCGGGEATEYFLSKGAIVTGVDISENCCEIFRKKFPHMKVYCSSMLCTELESASFDFIITDSLHHLHPDVNHGITEILRLLKPGGSFMFWEPTNGSIFDIIRKMWYRFDSKYFQPNELSIDAKKILNDHHEKIEILSIKYGGNLAYILVNLTMALRLPIRYLKFYARPAIFVENILNKIQPKFFSFWVLCLVKKK